MGDGRARESAVLTARALSFVTLLCEFAPRVRC
jgi:hypothetical protein